jgi:hypothetical protein
VTLLRCWTSISGTVKRIDLSLLSLADIMEEQFRTSRDEAKVDARLRHQFELHDDLDAIRFADEAGRIAFGIGVVPGSNISIQDRRYFQQARNDPKSGLIVSEPILGRVSGKWTVTLARRVNRPDGSFGGVIYAVITLEHLQEIFARLHLGSHGIVSLRELDMAMIVQHPRPTGQICGTAGPAEGVWGNHLTPLGQAFKAPNLHNNF